MQKGRQHSFPGFTLVELMIVVAIIAILATIAIMSYNGIQLRAVKSKMSEALQQTATVMDLDYLQNRKFPTTLPPTIKVPDFISISITSTARYENLSTAQNGLLFFNICNELISEGYGKGVNNGGQTEQYITACNVYNHPELQVNSAWSGHNLNTPVSATALADIASSIHYNDSWRPNRDAIEKTFYTTWNSRFLVEGGTYPVASFWDPWASPGNGIPKPTLPGKVENGGGWVSEDAYCIQAIYVKKTSVRQYLKSDNPIKDGTCPAKP